jgi:hypothetical protein
MSDPTATIEGKSYGEPIYKEGEAGSDLTPGELLVRTGTNAAGEPIYDSVSTVDALDPQAQFAQVPSTPPQRDGTTTDPVDQTISSGTIVEVRVYRSGDTVKGALLAAGGDLASASDATVGVGDTLGTNDDGALKATSTAGAGVATANEALDNSGASAGDRVRIDVEVL